MTHINKYSSKWASDQNQGLIKRLQLAIAKQKITKLTKVYSSLTFDQVITETKVENAESILIAMVENHEIHAKINKKLKLVVFEDRDDEIELDQIQDVCTRLIETTKFIENNLAKVALDKNYLKTTIGCENLRTG
jgi:predicted house-cleaning noncanonical NTP pyrophosphatase (MazG superfamily)